MSELNELLEKVLTVSPASYEEIKRFFQSIIEEAVSDKKYFEFIGSDNTMSCDIIEPHPPHVLGYYTTARAGVLETFCTGREGVIEIDGKEYYLYIILTDYKHGNGWTASRAKGFYYFLPKA
ncbi:hypothetical protein SBV1_gp45 [Sulfolobales Beppu virus 1]|nr:hypothetical protein SBV1_gp45 [Sulfolobales Beppu virus 1]